VAPERRATLACVYAAAQPDDISTSVKALLTHKFAHAPCQEILRLFSAYSFEPAKE